MRPHLAAHAFLLGGFTTFCHLAGSTASPWSGGSSAATGWTVRPPASARVLAKWGYRLGRQDDKLLPMVACQVFLLNRSPHL